MPRRGPTRLGGDRSVLALNRGSSSLKFGLFTLSPDAAPLSRGTVAISDDRTAFEQVLARVSGPVEKHPLAVVAHRLVHGGPNLRAPRTVDDALLVRLQKVVQLAPNHLPDEIALIEDVRRARPDLPQIVCFDTAFHADLPDSRAPAADSRRIRRRGHPALRLSRFVLHVPDRRAPPRGPAWPVDRAILAHLGNGSSLAAVRRRPLDRHHDGIHADRRRRHGDEVRRSRSRRRHLHRALARPGSRPGRAGS